MQTLQFMTDLRAANAQQTGGALRALPLVDCFQARKKQSHCDAKDRQMNSLHAGNQIYGSKLSH